MLLFSIISAVLGIAGFTLSLVAILRQRLSLRIDLISGFRIGSQKTYYIYCEIIISNVSALPLSIHTLSLTDGTIAPVDCLFQKKFVSRYSVTQGDVTKDEEVTFTSVPPIQLMPYGSFRGYVAFPCPSPPPERRDHVGKHADYWYMITQTNRGKIKARMIAPTSEEWFAHKFPNPYA